MTDRPYEGGELELFSAACNWKSYWSGKIARHVGKSVLEVGAGLGGNLPYLLTWRQARYVCLEPDAALASKIPRNLEGQLGRVETVVGTLSDLPGSETFETILYIDVLEHIEDDHGELRAALERLAPGGVIVVLSPAQPWLFSPFDAAIGHFRRYTRRSLRACTPPGAKLVDLYALDSFGLLASVANKLLLHQSMPTARQVRFWDGTLVPISRVTDPLIGFSLGKSLIAVWRKL